MINITAVPEALTNHLISGFLVTSGHCKPSAADEVWYSLKRPSSTVAVQLSDFYAEVSTINWTSN